MSIRSFLNEHSALSSIIAIVILVGALGTIMYSTMGGSRRTTVPTKRWFYNLTEKTTFGDDFNRIAPFKTEAGHEAVQAVVFHCGSCGEPQQIAYLMKYTAKAKKQMVDQQKRMAEQGYDTSKMPLRPDAFGAMPIGQLVSRPDKIQWLDMMDPRAAPIMQGAFTCPDDAKPVMNCFPDD